MRPAALIIGAIGATAMLGSCTEHRRADVPATADGDTVEVNVAPVSPEQERPINIIEVNDDYEAADSILN